MSNSSLAKVEEEEEKCLSCYGAETRPGQCCNTCDEVRAAYRKKGWALDNMDNVDQCRGEAERESLAQEEGCQVFSRGSRACFVHKVDLSITVCCTASMLLSCLSFCLILSFHV